NPVGDASFYAGAADVVASRVSKGPSKGLKNVDFTDRNAVEDFLGSERFRSSCDNLKCDKVALREITLYMPVCAQNRFARDGVAQQFDMPDRSKPVSPLTYSSIPFWAPHISCPPKCRGYRNRTIANCLRFGKQALHWCSERVFKPAEVLWAAFWAWIFK